MTLLGVASSVCELMTSSVRPISYSNLSILLPLRPYRGEITKVCPRSKISYFHQHILTSVLKVILPAANAAREGSEQCGRQGCAN